MGLLVNYAAGRIATIDTGLFANRVNNKDKQSFILEKDLLYPPGRYEQYDDYPPASEVMKIEPEISGEKQHNLRAQYTCAACP